MARPKTKTVYEKIDNVKAEIESTEKHLEELKTQLDSLQKEKDDLEMRQAWKLMQDKGISVEELEQILLKK